MVEGWLLKADMQTIDNYIDGAWVSPAEEQRLPSFDPATGEVYAQVAASTETDVHHAVSAAAEAFHSWSHTPASERSRVMLDMAARIESELEAFARAESIDSGKPISSARSIDIPRAIANLRFFATAVLHTTSEAHVTDHTALNYTLRRARGVAGVISPWNLPLYLLTWKIAPALATGNTVVAKPSEVTPMTAFMLTQVAQEAGLPAGVLNVVHGRGPEAGAALVQDPRATTISFTGSTRAGREIASATAPMFKKVALEMGGKNPNVIFADADFELALQTAVRAGFTNQGQVCLCGSRIFVEASIYDDFRAAFVQRVAALRLGDPLDEQTQQGALVSAEHLAKVESAVELARTEGGTVEVGGRRAAPISERCGGGYFFEPTVITGLGMECRTNQEEIFGPVVTLMPFETEDEVARMANATQYGLAATVWTQNLDRAHRVAERLEAGTVWINCWLLRDLRVPFGGMKASGVEREGGDEALRFFTEPKNVCVKL